jgi:hypothetical protein
MASSFFKAFGSDILREATQAGAKIGANSTSLVRGVGTLGDSAAKQIAAVAKIAAGQSLDAAKKLKGATGDIAEIGAKNLDGVAEIGAKNLDGVVGGVTSELAERTAREAAEKAAKGALPLSKQLKRGALTVGALTAIGLGTAQGISVYNRSKETFDKRNEEQFSLTSIASSNDAITITFINTNNLKIYPDEEIEIIGVDTKINGRFVVISQIDNTTITVKRDTTKPLFTLYSMNSGTMKLFADQKNDVASVIQDDLNKVADIGKGALCDTISFLNLTPYIDGVLNGAYIVFLVICVMILYQIYGLLNTVLGQIPYVKFVLAVVLLALIVAIHFLAGPLFVLKC